ncbi:hypothetical protein DRQ09_06795 [candidate division KSB1 bacterium]|nr:MAG: hypothetical protein DRQ09_06795 [candidate division KSB1 bacterium]
MGQDLRNFTFGGSSGIVVGVFLAIILFLTVYITYKLLKNYLEDKKKFGWIYELAKSKNFTRTEIQDLKEVAIENQIKNEDQLYRILHSVKMLSSTRRKLLFDTKEKTTPPKQAKRPIKIR